MSDNHMGGCACGAVRYRVQGAPVLGTVCHCRFCQRRLASAFAVLATFDEDKVEMLQGELVEREYVSDESGRWLRMSSLPGLWHHRVAHRRNPTGQTHHRRRHLGRSRLVCHRPPHLGALEAAVGDDSRWGRQL